MIFLKVIGLSAAIFAGLIIVFFVLPKLANLMVRGIDGFFKNKPTTPYNYRPDELVPESTVKWTEHY